MTNDKFVLQCIKGYKIPFVKKPPLKYSKYRFKKCNSDSTIISEAVEKLIEKGAIKECKKSKRQFLSPYFTVPKPDGTHRFILNLKKLNQYIKTYHFKYEDMKVATKLISKNDFMISLDLQDAFFMVSVHKNYRKYLRFEFNNKTYEFSCLPFGLSTSPYIFTKILKPALSFLRSQGYVSVMYLDDILCIGKTYDECLQNATATRKLFLYLGFMINSKKSKLKPNTICKFLGNMINSKNKTLSLTEKRKEKLLVALKQFLMINKCSILEFARVVGKVIAACPTVPYGWLHTKIFEYEKLLALIKSNYNYNSKITISNIIKKDVSWWVKTIPTASKSFDSLNYNVTIFTDASDLGWGATDGTNEIFGVWSKDEINLHINYKELLAVKLALLNLCDKLHSCAILLRIDNTTALSYINKMGGVRYKKYNILARSIWKWAESRKIWLTASYIPSDLNVDADRLSRKLSQDTEWELSDYAFEEIVQKFGYPTIDIFASANNAKCFDYFSWTPDPNARQIDAFTVSWKGLNFYAFPPFILILKTIEKIIKDKARGILIVPEWSNQTWYPLFQKIIVSEKLIFGPHSNLLLSLCRQKEHPQANHLRLIAAIVSGDRF